MEKIKKEIIRDKRQETRYKQSKFFFLLVACCSLLIVSHAQAATLSFFPSSGDYIVDQTLSVSIRVSSADQAMNAASGIISFPQDKLEVSSLSQIGSIFTIWIQDPSFSNSAGTVNFEGVALNPGFMGTNGKIITINFKVKATGVAMINFSSGSVMANDGKGTNILASSGLGNARFNLNDYSPIAPQIFSPTHPDQNKWYSNPIAKFTWQLPGDMTSVRLFYDKFPDSQPKIVYTPPIAEKETGAVNDGIYYFHAQFENKYGWGKISHYKFQIDTEKPSSFDAQEIKREDLTDPKVKFKFDAEDKTSGIDHYEVQIDAKSPQVLQNNESGVYETSVIDPGKYVLIAKAVDRAGNTLVNPTEFKFEIKPLDTPIITDWPAKIKSGDTLTIKGKTYPDDQITIWFQTGEKQPFSRTVKSDGKGNFVFTDEGKLKPGAYQIWMYVTDNRGAKSNPTNKIMIIVEQSEFLKIVSWLISHLTAMNSLLLFAILLILLILYSWHRFSLFKNKVNEPKKEILVAEKLLQEEFNLLKKDITDEVKMLEESRNQFAKKNQIAKRKEKTIRRLKKDLSDVEKSVKKEIEDIEK